MSVSRLQLRSLKIQIRSVLVLLSYRSHLIFTVHTMSTYVVSNDYTGYLLLVILKPYALLFDYYALSFDYYALLFGGKSKYM